MSTPSDEGSLGLTFNVQDYQSSAITLATSNENFMPLNELEQDGDESCSSSLNNNNNHQIQLDSDDDATGEFKPCIRTSDTEEDWNELLHLPDPVIPGNIEVEIEQKDSEDNNDEDDDENVSLSPPPSLPLVIVDLVKLCGHAPTNSTEADFMKDQVRSALFRDDDDDDNKNNTEQINDDGDTGPLSRHFDNRCQELFESGVAFHGTTIDRFFLEDDKFAVIPYPTYFCRKDQQKVLVTERQWKILLQPHPIPVVNRVLSHLSSCSRPFSWKLDMNSELRQLAKYEEKELIRRQREGDLKRWRTERRRAQLDKLYTVRETFDEKLETGQGKLEEFGNAREETLNNDFKGLGLGRQDQQHLEDVDDNGDVDFESATYDIFSQEENALGKKESRDDAIVAGSTKGGETEKSGSNTMHEQHRVMQAVVESIEKRLKQIDDLLESLQEEEWADEEEGLLDEENNENNTGKQTITTSTELTLLDQILAMILGEIHSHDNNSMESHFKYIRLEHKEIVEDWKHHFGRLPISLGGGNKSNTERSAHQPEKQETCPPSQARCNDNEGFNEEHTDCHGGMAMTPFTASDMNTRINQLGMQGGVGSSISSTAIDEIRKKVGIVENDVTDAWDDVEDWDQILPPMKSDEDITSNNVSSASSSSAAAASTLNVGLHSGRKSIGLRPGGKIIR